MKRIYVLGSLNSDLTVRAPRVPEAGETVRGSDFLCTAGGKGANQAYAAAKLGADVCMAGAVGRDSFGDALIASLQKAGADVSCVRRDKAQATGTAVILVTEGDNRIILDAGANGTVNAKDADLLLSDAWEKDIFCAQLEVPLPAVKHALSLAKEKGLVTVLNPAPAAPIADMVPLVDVIVPNESELFALTGERDVEAGAAKLLDMGAKACIVTLGGAGSYLRTPTRTEHIPAVCAGPCVDTTAAGDTYCGALLVSLAEGKELPEAAKFASLCAGITVTRRGAQVSIPDRAEADALARKLSDG